MGGWGCPYEIDGHCQRVNNNPCDPGMKGCILSGRFIFSNPQKNISRRLQEKAVRKGIEIKTLKPRGKT